MSSIALFGLGFAVSLVVFAALGLLVAGAILDGRDERERRQADVKAESAVTPIRPASVVPVPPRQGEAA